MPDKDVDRKQDDQSEDDAPDAVSRIQSLPRVQEIGWIVRPVSKKPEKKPKPRSAPVAMDLRPFTPKPKKTMVTMSDLGMGGTARTGTPARNKRRPSPAPADKEPE